MNDFTKRERVGLAASFALFVALAAVGIALFNVLRPLSPWVGAPLGVAATASLAAFVAITVRATRRQDNEGVEREVAAQASMVTVLVVVIAGFGYSLLEAFAGVPRLTAAVMSAFAGLVWMSSWTWLSKRFE
ncbi:hypothetical protein LQF12_07215 [Ruania suaedae]|uniref:hypothetical protein n=1 Tax=Ruania suaedae TaxID=2897774 RepID=UPI001E65CEA6|nr:hypothetical protein [Ruania suaedae]UFU04360.1 hypothetical protein LQF12_07215 [Ruania suaedae]